MSTKRKKNSINPAGKQVTFIKVHDDSPWEDDYYLCGQCGRVIAYKYTMKHAERTHHATRLQLLDVSTGGNDVERATT